jgi:peptidoglycan hydrolase CwlO-like protein
MKKALIAAVIVMGLGLAAAIYFCITFNQDKNALASELESTQNVLASTQAELASTQTELATTKDDLDSTQTELATTKDDLDSTQTELATTKDDLDSTQTELATTKDDLTATQTELDDNKDELSSTRLELNNTKETLASTESELENTNQQLTSKLAELNTANNEIDSLQGSLADLQDSYEVIQNRLRIAEDTLEGLGITTNFSSECYDVALIDNPDAVNPTWTELISFLDADQTEKNDYIVDVYDCSQFSRDVHNNAEAAGIRAAEVQVWFSNSMTGHALNAFITTDYGLVYVDCTEEPDTIARVKLNKEFRSVDKYSVAGRNARNDSWWDSLLSYYYLASDFGGHAIVSDIIVYW